MVNKLRGLAGAGGLAVALLAAWAGVAYGEGVAGATTFGAYVALGLATAALPGLVARGKLHLRRLRHRYLYVVDHPAAGTVFVSSEPVEDRAETLAAIRDALEGGDSPLEVTGVTHDGADALKVAHTAFHDSRVRFTPDDRVVVTGPATRKNRLLAGRIEAARPVSMTPSSVNPLWTPSPARGASRMTLGLLVVALVVVGTTGVAGAAYPSDAYNPLEKTVLVSIDARAALDPGTSPAEAKLAKASFLVDVLAEKRTEIRWELNDTAAIRRHARQAEAIASDGRRLLAAARADATRPAIRARADRIERRLDRAERLVEATARRQLRAAEGDDGSSNASAPTPRTPYPPTTATA